MEKDNYFTVFIVWSFLALVAIVSIWGIVDNLVDYFYWRF